MPIARLQLIGAHAREAKPPHLYTLELRSSTISSVFTSSSFLCDSGKVVGLEMFCKYCQSLDIDAATAATPWSGKGAPHHESLAALVASADNGCELCKWIADEAKERYPERFQQYLHSSRRIYCWYYMRPAFLKWKIGEVGFAELYICATKGQLCISASGFG